MKEKKGLSKLFPYIKGMFSGVASALIVIYLLNVSGLMVVSSNQEVSVVALLNWGYQNLGLSIIPFALTFLMYCLYLRRLNRLLETDLSQAESISATEEKVDLLMNIFFGIGVIWTAIGMRNALLAALGNMDAETAAQKGAFFILTQLVEGGILLALSTTIFGGIGGYIMRMIKAWVVGAKLELFFEERHQEGQKAVLDRLDQIAMLLGKRSDPLQGEELEEPSS